MLDKEVLVRSSGSKHTWGYLNNETGIKRDGVGLD